MILESEVNRCAQRPTETGLGYLIKLKKGWSYDSEENAGAGGK